MKFYKMYAGTHEQVKQQICRVLSEAGKFNRHVLWLLFQWIRINESKTVTLI